MGFRYVGCVRANQVQAMTQERAEWVHQSVNDRCSAIAQRWAQTTFSDAGTREERSPDFSHTVSMPMGRVAITSDGIGTKVEIAERLKRYDTLGFDLVAMVVDDLVAGGARPIALSNILDVNRFDEGTIEQLMKGLAAAARSAGVVVAGGETAQLGSRISGYGSGIHINWCATAIGIPWTEPASEAREPQVGDRLVALASDGFRSNGFTLARSILESHLGEAWHQQAGPTGRSWGECLLTPSRIYAPVVATMRCEHLPVICGVHITGGGIAGNVPRILKGKSLCAELSDLWPPHPGMMKLREMGRIDPATLYEQWNMGTGFMLVVPPGSADAVVTAASNCGVRARVAGSLQHGCGVRIDASAWGMGCLSYGEER